MHSYTHMHRNMNSEMHTSVFLQIDADSWVGEWALPVLHSLSVNTGADTPGEWLAELEQK